MARKRLSDLLREEAQKPTDVTSTAETSSQPEESVSEPESQAIAPSETPPDSNLQQDVEGTIADEATADLTPAIPQPPTAELHQQIAHLTTQLEQQTATITNLQTQLEERSTAANTLQTQLDQAHQRNQQLEAELTTAKQTALQLAESNAQLKQDLETLQQAQKPTSQESALNPVASRSTPTSPSPAKPLTQQDVLRRRQADSLAHPVFPSEKTPGQFKDQDIGWFD